MKNLILISILFTFCSCEKKIEPKNEPNYCISNSDTLYYLNDCPYISSDSIETDLMLEEIIYVDSCKIVKIKKKDWWINDYQLILLNDTAITTNEVANVRIELVNNIAFGKINVLNNKFNIDIYITEDLPPDEYDEILIKALEANSMFYEKNGYIYKYYNQNTIFKFKKL